MHYGAAKIDENVMYSSYETYCNNYDVFCDEIDKGQTWFVMGLISIILLICTCIGIFIELCKDATFIRIITSLIMAASVIVSVGNIIIYAVTNDGIEMCANNACEYINHDSDTDVSFACDSSPGSSLIFVVFGACSTALTAFFVFCSYFY